MHIYINLKQTTKVVLTSLIAALACTGVIYAATTVGNNITTGGTITSTGVNTFYGATTIGGTLTATSTLTVTGLTTLGNASTTVLSVSGNTYITGTLNVTSLTTLGNASTTALSVSGNLTVGDGTPDVTQDGEDAYIEGTLEVDGSMRVDSGSLQRDAKYIVFESGGTVYVVDGKTGEIVNSNATDHTAINWAISNLTGSRDNKERIALVGSFTITDKIELESYTILDMTNAELTVDSTSWGANDKEAIGMSDYINGVDHIEIIGGEVTWSYTSDMAESVDAGAETITMTGHPFTNGDKVYYYATADECNISAVDATGDDYWICNSTANTVQIDGTSSACAAIVNLSACTPTGEFRDDNFGVSGIGISAQGTASNHSTYTMPTPTCVGTCGNNVTIGVTDCVASNCRWQGYKETVYELKITSGSPDTFIWRAKYGDCTNGNACWSVWTTTGTNASDAAGAETAVEITHTDTNLLEFNNNAHVVWDVEDGGTTGDVWTVTIPYSEDIIINSVKLQGFYSHGIALSSVSGIVVENSIMSGMGDDGVSLLRHSSYASINNNTIYYNNSRKGGSSIVEVEEGSSFVSIVGNNSWGMGGVSVILDAGVTEYLASKNVTIQNNKVRTINLQGNATSFLSNIVVAGNVIEGQRNVGGTHGISATYLQWSSISNNTVIESAGHGIFLGTSNAYNTIANNTIRRCDDDAAGNTSYGINVTTNYSTITGNVIDDDRSTAMCRGILVNSGSYNTITGNNFHRVRPQTSNVSHVRDLGTFNVVANNGNDTLQDRDGELRIQNDAVTILPHGTTLVRIWASVTNVTLADGQIDGTIKTVRGTDTSASGAILTIPKWDDDDRTDSDALDTCVFSNDDESITLIWSGDIWRTLYKSCVWTDVD